MSAMSDELVLELTGYRPSDLNERDAALILERARLRWAKLLAVAHGHKTVDPVAYLVDWADIGEGAAQSLYYGEFAKQHMEGAVRYAADARQRSAKVTPLSIYAEPASTLAPSEQDWTEVDLWAEIHRLRAALKGPDGYTSWQYAATAERIRRVKAERALASRQEAPAASAQPACTCCGCGGCKQCLGGRNGCAKHSLPPVATPSEALSPATVAQPVNMAQRWNAVVQLAHDLDDAAQHITERQAYDFATQFRVLAGVDGCEAANQAAQPCASQGCGGAVEDCAVDVYSSRMCERGTKGCTASHAALSTAPRSLDDATPGGGK